MIRVWLSRRRAGIVAEAQIDYRDGLLEARAERNAELQQQLVDERAAHALELAQLRVSLATALSMQYLQAAANRAPRPGEEPTVVTSTAQLARSRPMDAPTEQWGTR